MCLLGLLHLQASSLPLAPPGKSKTTRNSPHCYLGFFSGECDKAMGVRKRFTVLLYHFTVLQQACVTYVTKSKRKREATKTRSCHPGGSVWWPQAAVPFPEGQNSPRSVLLWQNYMPLLPDTWSRGGSLPWF